MRFRVLFGAFACMAAPAWEQRHFSLEMGRVILYNSINSRRLSRRACVHNRESLSLGERDDSADTDGGRTIYSYRCSRLLL